MGDTGDDIEVILPPGSDCPVCGFQPSTVSPSDAVVALRSYPRRFRSTLLRFAEEDTDLLRRRPSPAAWTALEHAGHVRDVMHSIDLRMQRVLREDNPTLPEIPEIPPGGVNEQGPEVVVASMLATSEQLCRMMQDVDSDDWTRFGVRGNYDVSALDLVREAVHAGTHHLREAERVLAEVARVDRVQR